MNCRKRGPGDWETVIETDTHTQRQTGNRETETQTHSARQTHRELSSFHVNPLCNFCRHGAFRAITRYGYCRSVNPQDLKKKKKKNPCAGDGHYHPISNIPNHQRQQCLSNYQSGMTTSIFIKCRLVKTTHLTLTSLRLCTMNLQITCPCQTGTLILWLA